MGSITTQHVLTCHFVGHEQVAVPLDEVAAQKLSVVEDGPSTCIAGQGTQGDSCQRIMMIVAGPNLPGRQRVSLALGQRYAIPVVSYDDALEVGFLSGFHDTVFDCMKCGTACPLCSSLIVEGMVCGGGFRMLLYMPL